MIENLFIPTNCECDTRTTNTSSSLIDHIWTNKIDRVTGAFVIEDMYISDHKINGIALKDRHKIGKKNYTDPQNHGRKTRKFPYQTSKHGLVGS